VLTYIGRAAPEKNRGFLLRIHAEAKLLREGTTLAIVGPGRTDDLEAVDPAVRLDPLVHLAGETDQVDAVLADCDVLLLPSHREGLPGVVLEALAAGVPVLATDLPGLRDLATEVTGLTLLPLSAGPLTWARTALALTELTSCDRDRISDGMRDSRFTLKGSTEVWRRLWTDPR
jgi:glycosyltransferase involved in cell wall biosynthesis